MKKFVFVFLITLVFCVSIFAQNDAPTLFRQPTISKTAIVFSYAGDLWRLARSGGDAKRLTTSIGIETNPHFSPDGNFVAYEPLSQWQEDWKHYRGGQTQPIWIAKLADSTIEKVPRENSNDKNPMWIDDKIYFLPDRNNGVVSLFSFDTKSKNVEQIIDNKGLDIKYASAGADAIVYEQFGAI